MRVDAKSSFLLMFLFLLHFSFILFYNNGPLRGNRLVNLNTIERAVVYGGGHVGKWIGGRAVARPGQEELAV